MMFDYASTCGAATSTVCSSPATMSIKESQLKCPMCQQFFVKPVRLSCGHCFCMVCAEKWLRNCTTCSVCRAPTLNPVRDLQLEQFVGEAIEILQSRRTVFSRAISEPLRQRFRRGRTVREVKALQKESTRASMRRPKNLKFQELPKQEMETDKENAPRQSVFQRSFRRLRKIF